LDNEFERLARRGPAPNFNDVSRSRPVVEVWDAMASYLRRHDRYQPVLNYISGIMSDQFDGYSYSIEKLRIDPSFSNAIAVMEYDSGLAVRMCYEVIRIFNDHPLSQRCSDQFYAIGMAGKF